jgi:hypothetical protein
MSAHVVDEETPLISKPKATPLPWAQFSIILFIQLAEPLTSQVIYPFAPQVCSIPIYLERPSDRRIRDRSSFEILELRMATKLKLVIMWGFWYASWTSLDSILF